MGFMAAARDFFGRPYGLDLSDATILDGSNVLRIPDNRHKFALSTSGNEQIDKIEAATHYGRKVELVNESSNNVQVTHTAYGSAADGQITAPGGSNLTLGQGDSCILEQRSDGNWIVRASAT